MTSYHSGLEIQLRRAGDSKLSKRTQGGGSESSVLSQTYTSGHCQLCSSDYCCEEVTPKFSS